MKSFFITGTNTDVGKTFVTCALLHQFKLMGLKTLAMKPVAAGCELIDGQLKNEDALLLQKYATADLAYEQINPVALRQAIAPHIAAEKEGVTVDVDDLVEQARHLQNRPEDVFLIEGAGGWFVPLNENVLLSELPKRLKLPVVVVVDMQLGCISHALLTCRAVKAEGLNVSGWVANNTSKARMSAYDENIATLKTMIDAPCIAEFSFVEDAAVEQLSQYFFQDALKNMCDKLGV